MTVAKLHLTRNNLAKIPSWAAEIHNFWIFAAGIFLACLVGDWAGEFIAANATREDRVRYSGWLLDVLGLIVIVAGISAKLDRFRGKNLFQLIWDELWSWLRRFPLLSQHRNVVTGAAHVELSTPTLRGYGTVKVNSDLPVEEKVDWLLERYYELVGTVQKAQSEIDKNAAALSTRIEELEESLNQRVEEVDARTKELHVGDVGKEVVGLAWVFCGITFATVPEGVEAIFGWLIAWFEFIGFTFCSVVC